MHGRVCRHQVQQADALAAYKAASRNKATSISQPNCRPEGSSSRCQGPSLKQQPVGLLQGRGVQKMSAAGGCAGGGRARWPHARAWSAG